MYPMFCAQHFKNLVIRKEQFPVRREILLAYPPEPDLSFLHFPEYRRKGTFEHMDHGVSIYSSDAFIKPFAFRTTHEGVVHNESGPVTNRWRYVFDAGSEM